MAFSISTTPVITDAVAVNNITAIDETSIKNILFGLMSENTIASGTTLRASRDTEVASFASTTFVDHSFWPFEQKGTVQFYYEIRSAGSVGGSMRLNRRRNGAYNVIYTQNVTSTSYVAFTTDQSVLPGDVFDLQIQGASGIQGYMRNVRIRTSSATVYTPIGDAVNSYFWYTAAY